MFAVYSGWRRLGGRLFMLLWRRLRKVSNLSMPALTYVNCGKIPDMGSGFQALIFAFVVDCVCLWCSLFLFEWDSISESWDYQSILYVGIGLIVVDIVFLLVRDDAAWASIFVVGTICKVDLWDLRKFISFQQ